MVEWWCSVVVLASSLFVAVVTTPLARFLAWKVGAVDWPGARRINLHAVPRMGGIAIFVSIIAGMFAGYVASCLFHWPGLSLQIGANANHFNYTRIGISFMLIFLTGMLDDLITLTPKQKMLGQIVSSSIAVSGNLVIDTVVNPVTNHGIGLGWMAYPITVVYLVAYANIFNLIDGLDGLAAGIACIGGLTMWIISTLAGRPDAAMLSLALAGATLGFLRYNFNPASIFMGDSGSLLIGFVLGTISLMSVRRMAGLTSILVPSVIAGIPIIDTFSAIVRRGRAHVSIGRADKGHIHHRLMNRGLNQRQTVIFLYAWTTVLCIGSVMMTQVDVIPRALIFGTLAIASWAIALRLHLFQPVALRPRDEETNKAILESERDHTLSKERRA